MVMALMSLLPISDGKTHRASLTHSLVCSHSHSLAFTHSHSLACSHSHSPVAFTRSHSHSLALIHSHAHSHVPWNGRGLLPVLMWELHSGSYIPSACLLLHLNFVTLLPVCRLILGLGLSPSSCYPRHHQTLPW